MQRAHVNDAIDQGRGRERRADGGSLLGERALAHQHGCHLEGQEDRDDHKQRADGHGAQAIPPTIPGHDGHGDAEQCEDESHEGTEILEEDDRQLRLPGIAQETEERPLAAGVVGLAQGGAETQALQDDGDTEDEEGDPRIREVLGVLELVEALVEREEPAHEEEDDRDDEAVDVSTPAVAKRVLGVRRLLRALVADKEQHLVAGVGHRVDGLRQHRRRSGEGEGDELADGDAEIGEESGDDGLHATFGAHPCSPAHALQSPAPVSRARASAARRSD